MARAGDFLPTAPLEHLRVRARLLRTVRRFFDAQKYIEVETPVLSADGTVDANLECFTSQWIPAGGEPASGRKLFLQTSPEFAMKRLLAAEADAIYQVAKAFRNGELGRLHNPEFTIVEWYRVGDTYVEQMRMVEQLVRDVAHSAGALEILGIEAKPFPRTTYQHAFERHAGFNPVLAPQEQLPALAAERGLTPPPGLAEEDLDGWLNFLLIELVEPKLGQEGPEFLCDYPASQAALAKIRHDDPPVAERFELYVEGVEVCNGYSELTDADELRERMQAQGIPLERARRLLDAMDAGLPACAGVALGFDRLVMLALGAESLAEVVAFPFDRA